jgi:hypothetical protein
LERGVSRSHTFWKEQLEPILKTGVGVLLL